MNKKNIKNFFWYLWVAIPICIIPNSMAKYIDSPTKETPALYTIISWPDPMNFNFINLGEDHFLLATNDGMHIWDAKNNVFNTTNWPAHTSLQHTWSRLEHGTLINGESHDENDIPIHSLLWWDIQHKRLSQPFLLPPGEVIQNLVSLNQQYALVCMRTGMKSSHIESKDFSRLKTIVKVVTIDQNRPHWVDKSPDEIQNLLQSTGISGYSNQVIAANHPIVFNTTTCKWQINTPPDELIGAQNLSIKHQRLPDGRFLLSHAEWFSPKLNHWVKLAAPYIWNEHQQIWTALTNTYQEGAAPSDVSNYGIDDPVTNISTVDAEYVEFLDPVTLKWKRSTQKLPDTYSPALAPLTNGDALVFLREGGRVLRVSPLQSNNSGTFIYEHNHVGEVKLKNGNLLLLNGGSHWHPNNRPEILEIGSTPHSRSITPLPKSMVNVSGSILPDNTIIAYGGLPVGCSPSDTSNKCIYADVQPSYRYFPKLDQWREIPELKIPFSFGDFFDTGNSSVSSQWPRNDVIVRKNGDLIYLDAPSLFRYENSSTEHAAPNLMRWRQGKAVTKLAKLRRQRSLATLLELKDKRLVAIGGFEQIKAKKTNEMEPSKSTEIFKFNSKLWRKGPTAHYAGGQAVRLDNGKIFKLSILDISSNELSRPAAEIADAKFRHWKKLPKFPTKHFHVWKIIVAGNQVVVMPEEPSKEAVIWDDQKQRWKIWHKWTINQPLSMTPIDQKRLIVRDYHSYEIVKLPK